MQLATVGIFAALSSLCGKGEKRRSFDDFKGLAKSRPYSAAAITVFLLSMAGIPPTAGFMGKFYIIVSAIHAGQTLLAVLAIVSSILSLWYYLRLIIVMYFHQPSVEFEKPASNLARGGYDYSCNSCFCGESDSRDGLVTYRLFPRFFFAGN